MWLLWDIRSPNNCCVVSEPSLFGTLQISLFVFLFFYLIGVLVLKLRYLELLIL